MALKYHPVYSREMKWPNRTVDGNHDCLTCVVDMERLQAIEDEALGAQIDIMYLGIERHLAGRIHDSHPSIEGVDVWCEIQPEFKNGIRVHVMCVNVVPNATFCAEHLILDEESNPNETIR